MRHMHVPENGQHNGRYLLPKETGTTIWKGLLLRSGDSLRWYVAVNITHTRAVIRDISGGPGNFGLVRAKRIGKLRVLEGRRLCCRRGEGGG